MPKRSPVIFVLASMAVLPTAGSLSGCEGSEIASAADPKQQCRDLLALWCSESVDCVVASGNVAPADAASVLSDCQENGILEYQHDGLVYGTTPLFTKQPSSYGGVPTNCDAAVGVSATYDACLSDIRGEVCGPDGIYSPGPFDPIGPYNCTEVIQVPL